MSPLDPKLLGMTIAAVVGALSTGALAVHVFRLRNDLRHAIEAGGAMLHAAAKECVRRGKRIAELEDDLHEREDEAALVLSMGRELGTDADGTTGQSAEWQACARYYLGRYREVLAEVEDEPVAEQLHEPAFDPATGEQILVRKSAADAGPVNGDANGAPVSEVQS